ncbi:MAG: hypothetical protein SFT94_03755 [Pseudanabaenaceae cyanobacterium bins.68]|nr:hypothetical protein [Pseudanabaenaceae cyanobacterium bins.68]
MTLELKTASTQDLGVYNIYFRKHPPERQKNLAYGIALYQGGELQGERQVENSQPIPFQATWKPSSFPEVPVVCRVSFNDDADLLYSLEFNKAIDFIASLTDVTTQYMEKNVVDFPQDFYFKLFRLNPKLD